MKSALKVLAFSILLSTLSSCSPGYLIRASYEELNILLSRKDIKQLIENPTLEKEKKEKLKLVLEVREFCKKQGLVPKGSFSAYSEIDGDVLVWVLSGSLTYKLQPKFWWFPIVGSVPYKGFFSLEDAKEARKELEQVGYDTFLRPSDAFSTLGWFDDPLLSTVLKRDRLIIANTVLHEILHNTIWIKNNAAFNETMANSIGALGAIEFFKSINDLETAKRAQASFANELEYSKMLKETMQGLKTLYSAHQKSGHKELSETLNQERQKKFSEFKSKLSAMNKAKNLDLLVINNAYLIAQATYYQNFKDFNKLYEKKGRSLKDMIDDLKDLQSKTEGQPFKELTNYID